VRIAAIDLGTNSFHLLVADANPNGAIVPLVREKETLRLGEAVGRAGRISEGAADAVIAAMRHFCDLVATAGATELVACATSAIREAENGSEIVDRIARETGVVVDVISGRDEARMIFRAIRARVALGDSPALCFDLGGGSLEVMVGDATGLLWSDSVKLGVARLTAELVQSDPLSRADRLRLRTRLTLVLAPLAAEVADLRPGLVVGTSGTLCDLARLVAARRTRPPSPQQVALPAEEAMPAEPAVPAVPAGPAEPFRFSRREFLPLHTALVASSSAARRRLPGVDALRVDLLPAGSMMLATAMELFGFDEVVACESALREGMVLEAIARHDPSDWASDPQAVRRASVLALCRRCNWDEGHGRQVARLAGDLFDRLLPLHHLGQADRELLEHAALLHDVGEHVARDDHHAHSAYLIRHGKLRGFSADEVATLASVARYHGRHDPEPGRLLRPQVEPEHDAFRQLEIDSRRRVLLLAAILRVADGLDRGRASAVDSVEVDVLAGRASVEVAGSRDLDLELWGARRKRDLLERLLGRPVDVVGTDRPAPAAVSV
jgi:exopolyphosphatase/guanosine-5'-triphosphate,3'-diphosphate pyrophosphatase